MPALHIHEHILRSASIAAASLLLVPLMTTCADAARVGPVGVALPGPANLGGVSFGLGVGIGGGAAGGGGDISGAVSSGAAGFSPIGLQSGDLSASGGDRGPDAQWGDPLSMDLLGSDNFHARLRYYGSSDGTGTQQAVGIGISIPQ